MSSVNIAIFRWRTMPSIVGSILLGCLSACLLGCGAGSSTTADIQSTGVSTPVTFRAQAYQPPTNCLPCHQRQYDELRSAVKSGYRNVSPLFNGLEMSANFLNGGLLRPVYSDSTKLLPDGRPLDSNMYTTAAFTHMRQVQAGFCFTCHNPHVETMGNNPNAREVPELAG